jgi:hypothetical protein
MLQQNNQTNLGSEREREFKQTQTQKEEPPCQLQHKLQPAHQQPQQKTQNENKQPQKSKHKNLFKRHVHAKRQQNEAQVQFLVHQKQKLQFPSQTQGQIQNVNQEDNSQHQTEMYRILGYETEHQEKLKYQIPPPRQVQGQNQPEEEFERKYLEDSLNLMRMSEDHPFHQIQSQALLQYQSAVKPQTHQLLQHLQKADRRPQMTDTDNQPFYPSTKLHSGSQGLLMHLEGDPNEPVLCPMAKLPDKPCSWTGYRTQRTEHVMMLHSMILHTNNFIALSFNRAAILSVYSEYFLCYAVTTNDPKKLYCVAQHACQSHKCVLTYQYMCEIRAANGYEKITDIRLVGHFADDFTTLTKLGQCVRFDAEVVNYFTGNYEFNVTFTISIPELV